MGTKSIKCKKCGSENLIFMGELTISSPIKYFHSLSKKAFRDKDVKFVSFNWPKADIICCDCFYSSEEEKEEKTIGSATYWKSAYEALFDENSKLYEALNSLQEQLDIKKRG